MAEDKTITKATKNEVNRLQLKVEQIARTESIFNANQIQKAYNSTPKRWQYQRPAKGGGQWSYVKASYVRKVLDGIFGFNWDFEIETSLGEAYEVARSTGTCVVKGRLTGRVKHNGEWHTLTKTQFGRAEVKFKKDTKDPLDFGNDMKASTSDALKKCASLFGIASDIYEAGEFQEIDIVEAESNTEQDENLKKQIAKAKKEAINSASTKVGEHNGDQ